MYMTCCTCFSVTKSQQQESKDVPEQRQEAKTKLEPEKKNEHNVKHGNLYIYKWTGRNTHSQVCNVNDGQLTMEGDVPLVMTVTFHVAPQFVMYSTVGNPPGCSYSQGNNIFEFVDFEVYGLSFHGAAKKQRRSHPRESIQQSQRMIHIDLHFFVYLQLYSLKDRYMLYMHFECILGRYLYSFNGICIRGVVLHSELKISAN